MLIAPLLLAAAPASAEEATPAGICDRTEQVRNAIVGKISGVDNCADVTDAHLAAVSETLDLSEQSIATLQSQDFAGLSGLRYLWLDENELTALPQGLFSGLSNLKQLYLDNNELTALPQGLFSGLSNLKFLGLSNNDLTSLPQGVFSGLSSLFSLRLHFNDLTSLSASVFNGLSNLEYLHLHNNELTALPQGVFSGLNNLKYLYLYKNGLTSLPQGVFSALSRLKILWLNNNELTTLPQGVFSGLSSLTSLSLTSNTGSPFSLPVVLRKDANGQTQAYMEHGAPAALSFPLRVSGGTLSAASVTIAAGETSSASVTATPNSVGATIAIDIGTLPSLPISFSGLRLSRSRAITVPPAGICDRTEQVRNAIVSKISGVDNCADVYAYHLATVSGTMNLSKQSIGTLQPQDFAGLNSLTKLWLNSNGLTSLPRGVFSGLNNLRHLRLNENELTSLPQGVFNGLNRLEWLQLHGNELTSLPQGVFGGLNKLKLLYLHQNELTSLPQGVFNGLNRLEWLWLHRNELTSLPQGVFGGLNKLETLYLGYNELTSLSAREFSGLSNLKRLDLNSNGLTSLLQGVFDGLDSLTYLELHKNGLTSLPQGVFSGLSSLEYLYLHTNGLTSLSGREFSGLNNLEILDLNINGLTSLPQGVFSGLNKLRQLKLHGNELTSLPQGVFGGLNSLERLSVSKNGLTSLPQGAFSGLSSLEYLWLNHNGLTSLPEGVFNGLSSLIFLNVSYNAEAPFRLPVALRKDANGQTHAYMAHGAPTTLSIPLQVSGGSLSAASVTIAAGETSSESVTATPNSVGATIAIETGTLPYLPDNFHGLSLIKSPAITVPPAGICARTEQVRNAIVSKISGVDNCADVTDAHLAAVRGTLNLSSQSIATLQPQDFAGLSNLENLSLDDNGLTSLPQGVFSALGNLTTLSLQANELTSLPQGVFSALSNLENLYLFDNGLTSLPQSVFSALSNLKILYLHSNGLTSLPQGVFSALSNLEHLMLQQNELSSLPQGVFSALSNLENLTLHVNELTSLPLGVFNGLNSLKWLNLGSNSGAPFPLPVALRKDANGQMQAYMEHGAPAALSIPLQVSGGSLSAASVTIAAGETSSASVTATPNSVGATIAIEIGTLPSLPTTFAGLSLTKSPAITVPPAGICDRTEQVRNAIVGKISGVGNCADVTDAHLAAVRGRLDLREQSIVTLQSQDFAGLSSLSQLFLRDNQLTSLPQGVFSGLNSLSQLWLSGNQLTSLPQSVFSGLSSLTDLELSYNGLTSLPQGVFSGLNNLGSLKLYSNELTSLSQGVFSGLNKLRGLNLHDNQLTTLPQGVFSGLNRLQQLHLYGNQLTSLPGRVFSGLNNLEYLSLGNNRLTSLPQGLFSGLSNLEILYLDGNGLTSVLQGAFSGLSNLEILGLASNELTSLPEDVFSGLSSLQKLYLAGNELTSLPEDVFSGLNRLTNLRLDINELTSLPEDVFSGLSSLQKLYLYDNQMTELPAGLFVGLSSLSTADLSLNPGAPFPLPVVLRKDTNGQMQAYMADGAPAALSIPLQVSGGTLSAASVTIAAGETSSASVTATPNSVGATIAIEIGTLPSLPNNFSGLSLTKSPAITVPPAGICDRTEQVRNAIVGRIKGMRISGVESCADVTAAHLAAVNGTLDLRGDSIATLQTQDFSGLGGLTHLDLHENALTSLPEGVFSGLSSLTHLKLYSNQLTSLPGKVFSGLSSLTSLSLAINGLTSLPQGVFSGLSNLKQLDLGNNGLTSVSQGVFSGLNLTHLWLTGNELTSLPQGVFSGLNNLEVLFLNENELTSLPQGVFGGLNSLEHLWLQENELPSLRQGVFSDLGNLTSLILYDNNLTELPTGLFVGLSSLSMVNFSLNTGAPFSLPVALRKDTNGQMQAYMADGAPAALSIPLQVSGGTLSAASVAIAAGGTSSASVTATPNSVSAATTVEVGALPALPNTFSGLSLIKDLAIVIPPSGDCAHSQKVQETTPKTLASISLCKLATGEPPLTLNEGIYSQATDTGYSLTATGINGDSVPISLSGDNRFVLTNGKVQVAANSTFDYETESTITLSASAAATEDATLTAATTLSIDIGNLPPTANAGADQTNLPPGTTATLDGSASSDAAGGTLTYAWVAPIGITLDDSTVAKPTFTLPVDDATLSFSLEVHDGTASSAIDTVVVSVLDSKPSFGDSTVADQTHIKGKAASLTLPEATGGDGTLTYSLTGTLPAGLSFDAATRVLSGTPEQVAVATSLTYSVADSDNDSVSLSFSLSVRSPKAPTVTVSGTQATLNEGTYATATDTGYSLNASSESGTAPTLSLSGDNRFALSGNKVQVVAGSTFDYETTNSFALTAKATDASNSTINSTASITVTISNLAPTANAGADQTDLTPSATATLDGSASSDTAGGTLTYKWTAPDGVTLSSTTAAKPTFTLPVDAARLTFSLVVNDGTADSAADTVLVSVLDSKPSFGVSTIADQAYITGNAANLTLPKATGGNGTLTYSLTGTLPAGLSFDTATRVLSGTPEQAADATMLTYSAADSDNDSASLKFSVSVRSPKAPTVTVSGTQETLNEGTYTTATDTGYSFSASSESDTAPTLSLSGDNRFELSGNKVQVAAGSTFDYETASSFVLIARATDAADSKISGTANITVSIGNLAPTANAGADQTDLTPGATATLDGSTSSDTAGGTLTYAWTAPNGITLSSTTAAKPTFTLPADAARLTFSLVVNDGTADSAADTVVVSVLDSKPSFGVSTIADQTYIKGKAASLTLPKATGGNGTLTYTLTGTMPKGLKFEASSRTLTGTPEKVAASTSLTYSVSDGDNDSASLKFSVSVRSPKAPTVTVSGTQATLNEGTYATATDTGYSLAATSESDTASVLSLSGDNRFELSGNKVQVVAGSTFNYETTSSFALIARATDAADSKISGTASITVSIGNLAPTANAGPDQTDLTPSATATLDGSASADTAGGTLTYKWTAPAGIALSSTTAAKPTFTLPADAARLTFSLVVNDGAANSTADTVLVSVLDSKPSFGASTIADQIYIKGKAASLTLPQATGGNGSLTYKLAGTLPKGLAFDASSRTLSGTPEKVVVSSNLTYSVADSDNDSVSLKFNVFVRLPKAPTITVSGTQATLNEGTYATATDTGYRLSASSESDTAPTLSLSGDNRFELSGNKVQVVAGSTFDYETASSFALTAKATDGSNNSINSTAGITVSITNLAPTANAGPNQTGLAPGGTANLDGSASFDPAGGSLTYRWSSDDDFNVDNPIGAKTTVSLPSHTAVLTFSLIVSDGTASSTADTVVLAVTDATPSFIATVADQSLTQDTAASLTLPQATGGDGSLTYKLAGTLPAGLGFDADSRVLSGTPTAPATASLTYSATDADGDSAELGFKVTVSAPELKAPRLSVTGAQRQLNEGTYATATDTGFVVAATASNPKHDEIKLTLLGDARFALNSGKIRVVAGSTFDHETQSAFPLTVRAVNAAGSNLSVSVIVNARITNLPPTANAGPDQNGLQANATATLDGSASADPAGGSLTYRWTAPPGIILSDSTAAKPTLTLPSELRDLTFSLTVNDGALTGPADTVVLSVTDAAPSFSAPTATLAHPEQSLLLRILPKAIGGDGKLTYGLTGLPSGLTFASALRMLSGRTGKVGTHNLIYTATDEDGDVATQRLTLSVTVDRKPSFAQGGQVPDRQFFQDTQVTINLPSATGGDGNLRHSLAGAPAGLSFDAGKRTLSGSATGHGVHSLTYSATDSDGDSVSQTFRIKVFHSVCKRPHSVLVALLKATLKVNCEDLTPDDLATVIHLNLSNAGLESLHSSYFSGLVNLQSLDLSGNNLDGLAELPSGSGGGGGLSLASVPSGPAGSALAGLDSLQSLDLSGNNLGKLSADSFSGLDSLQSLDLSGNNLDEVPEGTFEGLSNLRSLDLSSGEPIDFALTLTRTDAPEDAAGPARVSLSIAQGAPTTLKVPLLLQGDAVAPASVTLPAGATEVSFTVTQPANAAGRVTVTLGELPPLPAAYKGFTLTTGEPLTLFSDVRAVAQLPRLQLNVGDGASEVDLAQYFTNLDSDTDLRASSRDSAVVRAAISGAATLLLTPVGIGQTTVSVQANSATLSATVVVSQRDLSAHREILARHGLTLAASADAAIAGRLDAISSGMRGTGKLSADGKTFEIPLQASTQATASEFKQGLGGRSGGLAVWGVSDQHSLAGSGDLNWRGNIDNTHFGIDGQLSSNLVGGVLMMRSTGSFSLDTDDFAGGEYNNDLTSIHPYLAWTGDSGLQLWMGLGAGSGSIGIVEDGELLGSGDASLDTMQLGISGPLLSGGTKLDFKGELLTATLSMAGNSNFGGMSGSATRLRAALQSSWSHRFRSGATLEPSLTVGMRSDSGDLEVGGGTELGGGLRFTSAAGNLTLETGFRTLQANGGYEESGFSFRFEYAARKDGRGLFLSVEPSEGEADSNATSSLWNKEANSLSTLAGGEGERRMEAEVSYGMASGVGVWQPYTGVSVAESGSQQVEMGTRLALSSNFDLDLGGELGEDSAGDSEQKVRLGGKLRF